MRKDCACRRELDCLSSSGTMASREFEVLLEFGGSRRPLVVNQSNLLSKVEQCLGKLGVDGRVILSDHSSSSSKHVYILQQYSDKWKKFIDVVNFESLNAGDCLSVAKICISEDHEGEGTIVVSEMTLCVLCL